ncbi:MAG: acyl-CoA dehydrogenase family protein [Pirellulaceae bacterium]
MRVTKLPIACDVPDSVLQLCLQLEASAADADARRVWPAGQIEKLSDGGVFAWFVPKEYGGLGWSETQVLEGYLALSQSCLTTAFILTQWNAACKRILGSSNLDLKSRLLPMMASGELFATVGISHLTTSRQHVGKPVLTATRTEGGFLLDGFSPWVTAAPAADVYVLGASLDDGTQLMAAVMRDAPGLKPGDGGELVGLNGSCTDQVAVEQVFIPESDVVAGPVENVMSVNSGGGAGGLQTSMLALGLTLAAARFLNDQAEKRTDLQPVAEKISHDAGHLLGVLRDLVAERESACNGQELRQQANSLTLRATQAALSAAKGAGFVASHPAGRWAKEALFFLVWSCPQPVVSANLCELAQLGDSF